MLANSLLHLGRAREAVPASETALRLDPRGPNLPEFLTILGFSRLQLRQFDDAIACFSRARAANPKLARAHVGAAIAFASAGDVAAARRAAGDLLRLVPDYCLSQTIDGCMPASPAAYRQFYTEVLQPGADLAGVPV
jgi:tetratricopeptide (TPR) repeat protein